jgi:hypothetical protein
LLTGQITQSQLYSTLSSRIDLIDAASSVSGSVNARIAVVQSQVNDLLNTPSYSNSTAYAAGAVVTYNGSLYQALQATTGNLPTNATYWKKIGEYASLGDAVAAHTTQISNLQSGLDQEVTDRTLLASQMRGSYSGSDIAQVTSGLLYEERTARSTADTALSSSISSLSSTVTNNYNTLNSAITSEQTTRSTADSALASSIYSLQSTASGMEVTKSWNFDANTEGFAVNNASISWSAGSLRINSSNNDPILYTPSISLDGSKGYLIRARIKRLAGSAWDGKIYYTTASHGDSETYRVQIADGTATNEWRILEWDMSSLSDWTSSTILGIRIDLGASSSDQFLIDWISVSRVAPMPLASQATLQTDYYTKTATDSAIASATTNLVSTTTLNSTLSSYVTTAALTNSYYTKTATDSAISSANSTLSASIASTYPTSVSVSQNYYAKASGQALESQYTVKIDNNGYVSGFGLASTLSNGAPSSSFMVRADTFSVVNPSVYRVSVYSIGISFSGNIIYTNSAHGFSVGDKVSFQNVSGYTEIYTVIAVNSGTEFKIDRFSYSNVTTASSYVAKVAVPFIVDSGNVYIDTAIIKDASITTAKISSLTADKVTTGNLTAIVNNTGTMYGGVAAYTIDGSGNYVSTGYTPGGSSFGTGYLLGAYGGATQFFIGSPTQNLLWNGTSLSVKGSISASSISGSTISGGTISGTTINGTTITGGTINGSDVVIGSSPAISTVNNTIMTGSGIRLYSDGTAAFGNSTTSMVWNGSGLYLSGLSNGSTVNIPGSAAGLLGLSGYNNILDFTIERGSKVLLGVAYAAGYYALIIGGQVPNYHSEIQISWELFKDGVTTGSIWNMSQTVVSWTYFGNSYGWTVELTLAPGTYHLKVRAPTGKGRLWNGSSYVRDTTVGSPYYDAYNLYAMQAFVYQVLL